MKKELLALALLAAVVFLSIWDLRYLDRLTGPLLAMTEEACSLARAGKAAEAEETARRAQEAWLKAGPYTHVFLRHPEVDAVSDAFCAFRGAIAGGGPGELTGAYLSLQSRLRGIREMEQPRLGSIF